MTEQLGALALSGAVVFVAPPLDAFDTVTVYVCDEPATRPEPLVAGEV